MKNEEFNRIYNVLDYKFNNIELLYEAFTINSNNRLIEVGDMVIDEILLKDIGNSEDIRLLKDLLWFPIKTFDLLEYVIFDFKDVEELFTNDKIKIEVFKSIIGAIYLDSKNNIEIVRGSFYSVFDISLELINKIINDNYIYYIRSFVNESSFNEYAEEYIHVDDTCRLILDFDGSIDQCGSSKLESRYNACKAMFDRLLEYGYVICR